MIIVFVWHLAAESIPSAKFISNTFQLPLSYKSSTFCRMELL